MKSLSNPTQSLPLPVLTTLGALIYLFFVKPFLQQLFPFELGALPAACTLSKLILVRGVGSLFGLISTLLIGTLCGNLHR
jgi:hypothetical protein